MITLRERLIQRGWQQGVILETKSLQCAELETKDDVLGYLVLTQTCDCVNPSFEKEPHLEVLPLIPRKTKKGHPDPDYENGKNPREIHFWITVNGKQQCAISRIRDIKLIDRACIEDFQFSQTIKISRGVIDDIVDWRAARYSRTAFPEAFEAAFGMVKEPFKKIISAHHADIDSLLIFIDPFDEIKEGDCYEIQLFLMVKPRVMSQNNAVANLNQASHDIEKLLMTCDAFAPVKCFVKGLAEMSLWEARNYMDFSRFDYLSFGQEEEPTDEKPQDEDFHI